MPANPPPILVGHPELLRDLVLSNRILAHEGVVDAFGHVSVRHPDHPDRFVIARALGPELVTEDDLQVFGLDGERFTHAAVYEVWPDARARQRRRRFEPPRPDLGVRLPGAKRRVAAQGACAGHGPVSFGW